jgi:hypothetical protein
MSPNATEEVAPLLGATEIIKAMAPASFTPERMIISFPDILKNISNEMEKTSKEVLQTWNMWQIVMAEVGLLRTEDIDPIRIFMNTLEGRVSFAGEGLTYKNTSDKE